MRRQTAHPAVLPKVTRPTVPWMHGLRILVAASLMVLSACAGTTQSVEPSPSPSPVTTASPRDVASASPNPTATPPAPVVELDTLVRTTVDDLSVRTEPTLTADRLGTARQGARAWVVDGPVAADGYEWFLLAAAPDDPEKRAGCLRDPNGRNVSCFWFGWAAAKGPTGEAWLERMQVDCPAARDVDAYLSLTPHERLFCARDEEWQLEVYVPPLEGGRGCLPMWATDPAWMEAACTFTFPQPVERELDEDTSLQMFTPPRLNKCGEARGVVCWWNDYKGRWVVVTGHLDDPVARECVPMLLPWAESIEDPGPPPNAQQIVHNCRLHFVVSSVRER